MRLPLFALGLCACASATLHYDAKPAPSWLEQLPVSQKAGIAEAVGCVAASADLRADAERAFDVAKQRLAESLVSEIRSQSSDWSWSKGQREQTVVEQTVDVRTDIKVEGVVAVAAYRDEVSAAQYVLARVDFNTLAARVRSRLKDALDDLDRAVSEASAKKDSRTAHALFDLGKLRARAEGLVDDARLLSAIAARDATLDRYRALQRRIDEVARAVTASATFTVSATGPDPAVCDRMSTAARELLRRWGFSEMSGKDPAVRVVIDISSKHLRDERFGERTEFVYGAEGSARLFERACECNDLSATLPGERYTETHASEDEAKRRALDTGADTLLSIWRSTLALAAGQE